MIKKIKTSQRNHYIVNPSKFFIGQLEKKEISFLFIDPNLNMNLSNHKFIFEAFQLPYDFIIKPSIVKETLEKINKIDKDKLIYEKRGIKVYSNHQISNEDNNNDNISWNNNKE
jgi:hypothetical protein